ALLLGLLAQTCQILLLRELLFPAGGSPELLGIYLWAWLLGGAAGATRGSRARMLVLPAALGLAIASLLALRLFGPLPPRGAYVDPSELELFGFCLLSAGPTAFVLGLCFPALAGHDPARGARVYDREAFGAFAAGLVLSLFPLPQGGAWLALALLLVACLALRRSWRLALVPAFGLAVASPLLDGWTRERQWARALPGWRLVETRETQRGNRSVLENSGERAHYLGGALHRSALDLFDVAGPTHLAALAAPARPRVLMLGHASPAVGQALAVHGPRSLLVVGPWLEDLEPLPQEAEWPAGTERRAADPRAFLASQPGGCFDLLLVSLDPLAGPEAWRLLTREALTEMGRVLDEDGAVTVLLAATDGELPPGQRKLQATVLAAMRCVFPEVGLVPGATTILLGTSTALDLSAEALERRWHARGVVSAVFDPELFQGMSRPEERRMREEELSALRARPALDLWPTLLSLARDARREEAGRSSSGAIPLALAGGVTLVLLLLATISQARRRADPLVGLSMAGTGFLGTSIAVLLLCSLAARTGTLYGQLGVVLGSYMFGVWGGARVGRGPARRLGPLGAELGNLLLALALALLLPNLALRSGGISLAVHALLAFLAGVAGGLAFPILAVRWRAPAGSLYGIDLLGGALGALVLGALLIPSIGAVPACLLCASVKLPTALLWWRVRPTGP
ncbi:MAG: hypothetical protein ACE5F1_14505, partial [Planctomycetota bacterium]